MDGNIQVEGRMREQTESQSQLLLAASAFLQAGPALDVQLFPDYSLPAFTSISPESEQCQSCLSL